MKKNSLLNRILSTLLIVLAATVTTQAQFLRTSYFMEGTSHRTSLNPALRPTKGYVNLPVIGMFNASVSSNTLGSQDIIDVIGSNDDFYNNDKFMNQLKDNNTVNASINTDILSFGFYKGKGFWSFSAGLRTDINASVPKSMFEYMRDMDSENFNWAGNTFSIKNQNVNVNSYAEIGLGYSRAITDRLTVGAKLKFLGGAANMKLNINEIYVRGNMPSLDELGSLTPSELNNMSADIRVNARMEGSFKGIELEHNDKGYVDDLSVGGFGIAGYGGAIDLGASYRVLDNLTVSAAILDLGKISWSKSASKIAETNINDHYDQNNYQEFYDLTQGGDVLDFDMLRLKEGDAGEGHKTTLASTLVLGAEYGILNNKVALGALYTSRHVKDDTMSEITLSANFRPKSWLNAAVSYSMIQSAGKSIGAAVKLGPLMLGTDYIFLGNNSKCANAYIGLSIPLAAGK